MTPTLVMLHGWGFDATLFDTLRAMLPEYPSVTWDRGYFGPAARPEPKGPVLGVGHSLGALLLAADPPPGCIGLVAINGFDRFTGGNAVAPRVMARMRRRFEEAPAAVLAEFRARCGVADAPAAFDRRHLSRDLALLATAAVEAAVPVLALHGDADPILTGAMRAAPFRSSSPGPSPALEQVAGGHLLPLTHPGWCADRIRGFPA